jgi:hypothetical protein
MIHLNPVNFHTYSYNRPCLLFNIWVGSRNPLHNIEIFGTKIRTCMWLSVSSHLMFRNAATNRAVRITDVFVICHANVPHYLLPVQVPRNYVAAWWRRLSWYSRVLQCKNPSWMQNYAAVCCLTWKRPKCRSVNLQSNHLSKPSHLLHIPHLSVNSWTLSAAEEMVAVSDKL